jgi:3-oxoacyl-[acyl-carrier protein] reductase
VGIVALFIIWKLVWRLLRQKKFDWTSSSTFLVTGAASGIGKKLVESLLERGQKVVAADINWEGLQQASIPWKINHNANIMLVQLDITQPKQWDQTYTTAEQAFGGIDVHMNVAGYLRPGYTHELQDADIERHVDINLKGVMYGTRAAARHMIPKRKGFIMNIASMGALIPTSGIGVYGATKAAVRSFTMAASKELKLFNVGISNFCPDAVRTPMLDLQQNYKEATITFTGTTLEVEDVVSVILDEVVVYQPVDTWYPLSRGLLARFGDTFYDSVLLTLLETVLMKKADITRRQYVPSTKTE